MHALLLAVLLADDLDALRARAGKGDAEAMFQLGLRHHKGEGVEKDDKAALQWHKKAAEKDHTKAEVQVGYMVAHGFGTKQDFAEAWKWYRKAAAKGDPTAQHNLGLQSLHGQGVKKDAEQTYRWFLLAAVQGHPQAAMFFSNLGASIAQARTSISPSTLLGDAIDRSEAERNRIFGKDIADEYWNRYQLARFRLGGRALNEFDDAVVAYRAAQAVGPRKFGQPGILGTVRGWYIWEVYDPKMQTATVRRESDGETYSTLLLPHTTTYRRLAYGASPADLLPGERVNLFFAPSDKHERGLLVHFQDEIGQMKGHGHFWQVLASDDKGFTARVMAGDKPLDGKEQSFIIADDCERWHKGKQDGKHRPAKGDKLYLTWTKKKDKNIVRLLADDDSLNPIRDAESDRIDKRIAKEGMAGDLQIVEGDEVSFLIYATNWQQAAKLKPGQRVTLKGPDVACKVVSAKNRGAYGSGPTDVVLQLDKEADAAKVRKLYFSSDNIRLVP